MTNRDWFILKVAFVLICIALLVIVGMGERRRLDRDIREAMIENANLKSEIATLEAANNAYNDYFDHMPNLCVEMRAELGIGG